MEQLVGSQELTRLLGVNRARVYQLTQRDDFPEPVAILAMGSIWQLSDVMTWAREAGRTIHAEALDLQPRARRRGLS